jgi:hypothetical protein
MWKSIPKPMRRWLILAVVLPLAVWGLERLGDELAERRGENPATRALRTPRRVLKSSGVV